MNRLRRQMLALGGACLLPRSASAQQTKKLAQMGWLTAGSWDRHAQSIQAFRESMRALGRNEGRDFAVEFGFADKPELFASLAAKLVRHEP